LFAGLLGLIEELDDALVLLRRVNTAAANPTPYFQFDIEDDAAAFCDRRPVSLLLNCPRTRPLHLPRRFRPRRKSRLTLNPWI
jgi:hypothetical protein